MSIFAQNRKVHAWEKVIRNGFIPYGEGKNLQQNLKFAVACDSLGDYYYSQRQFSKALDVYKKVADLQGHHADGDFEEDDTLFAQKHCIALEKVGKMLLLGLGVPADTIEAYSYLDRHPNNFSNEKRYEFSQLFFSHTKPMIIHDRINNQGDTLEIILINPFLIYDTLTALSISSYLDIRLRKIKENNSNFSLIIVNGQHCSVSEYNVGILYWLSERINGKIQDSTYQTIPDIQTCSLAGHAGIKWPAIIITKSKQ